METESYQAESWLATQASVSARTRSSMVATSMASPAAVARGSAESTDNRSPAASQGRSRPSPEALERRMMPHRSSARR